MRNVLDCFSEMIKMRQKQTDRQTDIAAYEVTSGKGKKRRKNKQNEDERKYKREKMGSSMKMDIGEKMKSEI